MLHAASKAFFHLLAQNGVLKKRERARRDARMLGLLKTATAEGVVIKVADDLYFDKRSLDGLKDKLVAHLHAHYAANQRSRALKQ